MTHPTMTLKEIAEHFGVGHQTAVRWHQSGRLGTPAAPQRTGNGRPEVRYHREDVYAYARVAGRLDADNNPVPLPTASDRYVLPSAPGTDAQGRRLYYLNHVAKSFGLKDSTVRTMRARGQLPAHDRLAQGKPVWFEGTLATWARGCGRTFNTL